MRNPAGAAILIGMRTHPTVVASLAAALFFACTSDTDAPPPHAPPPSAGEVRVWDGRIEPPGAAGDARVFWVLDRRPGADSLAAGRTTAEAAVREDGGFGLERPRGAGVLSLWRSDGHETSLLWSDEGHEDGAALPAAIHVPARLLGVTLRIVDERGRAVRGARVSPLLAGGGPLAWTETAVTDERGVARVAELPAAEWRVQIDGPVHAPVRVAAELELGSGEVRDVVIAAGAPIEAVVADTAGRRVKEAVVELEYAASAGTGTTRIAWLARDGRLRAVVPRTVPFVMHVTARGHAPWVKRQLDAESIDVRLSPIGSGGERR